MRVTVRDNPGWTSKDPESKSEFPGAGLRRGPTEYRWVRPLNNVSLQTYSTDWEGNRRGLEPISF